MRSVTWIDDDAEWQRAVERWLTEPRIAFDTEFVFERTFRPQLGLLQVVDTHGIALVDAVGLDLAPLRRVLESPHVLKIAHSGAGDVAILARASGAAPRPFLDTQVAAAFAGLGAAPSYQALVRELFAHELGKHETRTNWLRRPLRPEQLTYAAEDVEWLLPAASELEGRLAALGRLDWAREDSAELVERTLEPPATEDAWRRVKGLGRLPGRLRPLARALAVWREREAEARDLARPFLLRDETLLALVKRGGVPTRDLERLPGFDARRHGAQVEHWRAGFAEAEQRAGEYPDDRRPAPPKEWLEAREALDGELATAVEALAGELALPPELLLSRRRRERALGRWQPPAPFSSALAGFRRQLLAERLDPIAAASPLGREPL